MDIWTASPGADLPVPASLRAAADAVRTLFEGTLDALHWYPAVTPPDGELRLRAHHRSPDGRAVTLRLSTVDGQPLADVRLRRGGPGAADSLLTATPERGATIRRRFTVDASMLTGHVPGREPVLTTPDLVAFLEDTAADLLRPRFAPGVSSLGTWIGIRHTGPAWLGEQVDVTATVLQARGRRFTFDVRACVGARELGVGQVAQTLIRA